MGHVSSNLKKTWDGGSRQRGRRRFANGNEYAGQRMPGQSDSHINSDTGPRTTYDQLLDVIMPDLAATSHRLPCVSGTQAE